jgi:serine/threonine protein kinase
MLHDIDINDGIHYMSPEYIEEKKSSKVMDLWALGCITFELLTGTKPFDYEGRYKKYYPCKGASLADDDKKQKEKDIR